MHHSAHRSVLPALGAVAFLALAGAPAATAQALPPELYRDIALVQAGQGRHAEAVENFRRAIALEPSFTEAHTGLGIALIRLRRYDEALVVLRTVEQAQPRSARARYDVGLALTALERHDEASARYADALALDPAHREARLALLATLGRLGRPDEALAVLARSGASRDEGSVFGGKALAAAIGGRHADAAALWRRALRADPAYFEQRPAERTLYVRSLSISGVLARMTPD